MVVMVPGDTGLLKEILIQSMVIILGYCHYPHETKSLESSGRFVVWWLTRISKVWINILKNLNWHIRTVLLSAQFLNNLFSNPILPFLNRYTFHYKYQKRQRQKETCYREKSSKKTSP